MLEPLTLSTNTALSNANLGFAITCTGSMNQVTLMAAGGHKGQALLIRCDSGLTGRLELKALAGETIDGATSRLMWAGESVTLYSDDSKTWRIANVINK